MYLSKTFVQLICYVYISEFRSKCAKNTKMAKTRKSKKKPAANLAKVSSENKGEKTRSTAEKETSGVLNSAVRSELGAFVFKKSTCSLGGKEAASDASKSKPGSVEKEVAVKSTSSEDEQAASDAVKATSQDVEKTSRLKETSSDDKKSPVTTETSSGEREAAANVQKTSSGEEETSSRDEGLASSDVASSSEGAKSESNNEEKTAPESENQGVENDAG
jgi:hypothetical protein